MPYCARCGNKVTDADIACTICFADLTKDGARTEQSPTQPLAQGPYAFQWTNSPAQNQQNPPPKPTQSTGAPAPQQELNHKTVTFVPVEQVPNERILWHRDLTRGIIHKQVIIQERIPNIRIFRYNVETHQLLSQIGMKSNPDVIVSNARRSSQSYGGGSFVSSYAVGTYSGSRSGTSRTIGDVVIMEKAIINTKLSNVVDPQGVKQLINTIKREVRTLEKSTPPRPSANVQALKSRERTITLDLRGSRSASESLSIKAQDYLEDSSVEQLAEDLANFVKKEFPESSAPGVPYAARGAFWASKGIASTYALKPELQLKTERASALASETLTKMRAAVRSKLEQSLIDECLTWAKQHGLKKLTKADVDGFLHGKEATLADYSLIRYNYAISRDTIYREVNFRLSQS